MDPNGDFERHPEFYFPNGDVILAVKFILSQPEDGPRKYQIFRVHKFLLSLRSPVFSNLFADGDGDGPESGTSYDGVPFIELPGDNPEDFALLLSCLYEAET